MKMLSTRPAQSQRWGRFNDQQGESGGKRGRRFNKNSGASGLTAAMAID
jgi:hypothetical protein